MSVIGVCGALPASMPRLDRETHATTQERMLRLLHHLSTIDLLWTQNPSSQTAKAAAAAFDQLLAVAQLQEEVTSTTPAHDGLLKAIARQLLALGEALLLLARPSVQGGKRHCCFSLPGGGSCA